MSRFSLKNALTLIASGIRAIVIDFGIGIPSNVLYLKTQTRLLMRLYSGRSSLEIALSKTVSPVAQA
ncbi:MAG: hypothetical protein V7K50_27060 [Nostoc sp.]